MNLRTVKHFCPPFFSRSVLRFIFKDVTFYKIHILRYYCPKNICCDDSAEPAEGQKSLGCTKYIIQRSLKP